MAVNTTPIHGMPLVAENQAAKEALIQEVTLMADLRMQVRVLDKDLTAPPGGESDGDRYIVGGSATGDWSGEDDSVATYYNSGWNFITPYEGWTVWVADEDLPYVWTGAAWSPLFTAIPNDTISGDKIANGTIAGTNIDMTGQTLTLDNDEISGDKVHAGTISSSTLDDGAVTGTTSFTPDDDAVDLGGSSNRFQDAYLSGGAYLGGTAAANKLDDYDNNGGTYTPALSFETPGTLSVTHNTQVGHYVLAGKLCWFHAFINYDLTKGTATGDLTISLPFTAASGANFTAGLTVHRHSTNLTYTGYLQGRISQAASVAEIWQSSSGAASTALDTTNVADGTGDYVEISGCYRIA